MKNNTYKVRSQAVSTVKKSQASIPCACARRNSPQQGPSRRGAGPTPERLRIDLIVVAPTETPSLRSSPWIRTQPQPGFSRPRRGQLVPEPRVLHLQSSDRRAPREDAKHPPQRQEHEEQEHPPILWIAQPGRSNQNFRALYARSRVSAASRFLAEPAAR